jgi:hypothetical protein
LFWISSKNNSNFGLIPVMLRTGDLVKGAFVSAPAS